MAKSPEDLIRSLCDLEIPKSLRLSPDRSRVLYSTELTWGHRKGNHAVSTLWLASTDRTDSQQLTPGLFRDHSPAWTPDGKTVAFVSDRAAAGAKWAIYLLPLQLGGEAYPITPVENTSPIESFAFSPDGNHIAFLSADEASTGANIRAWGEDWRFTRLRVLDLHTKQIQSATLDRHVKGFCWSPDGTQIGVSSCLTPDVEEACLTGTTVSVIDANLNTVEEVSRFPGAILDLTWAAGGNLYFCGGVPDNKICAGHGVYRTTATAESQQYELVGFGVEDDAIGLVQSGSTVFVNVQHRLEARVCLLDGTVLYSRTDEMEAFDAAMNPDGEFFLVVAISDINHPPEVYSTSSSDSAMTRLSNHGQKFKNRSFGECDFLNCMSTDGDVELDALYLTPASSSEGVPLPTAVLIHGGPNTRLTNAFNTYYYMLTPYLLSLGFGVLLPNYRGSSGRGQRFGAYSIGGLGVYDYSDVIALTQCAIDQGFADKEKLLVGGWSQGGFIANLCSVRNGLHDGNWRFRAAVSGASICDIDAMALTSDVGATFEPELSGDAAAWNMDVYDTRNRAASALWGFKDAVQRAEREGAMVVPPMLILHGEADVRVPVSQTCGLRRALRSYGLPFELVTYPGQGHMLGEQKYWVDLVVRIGRWCEKYIGEGLS
ncbi:putative acylamino-acid-releasing enzyme [Aspergillus ellipticus CBS 707.79]|uniref:Dipeptidyl-peptidase V n=1 Tax=Aspergillus ellipticus CBS 707.79 TaxID=1448320 RepID=A0A319F0D7_9EURO|nr:putative acylamino-acid-releasing enzyme [Aspergillus ellipticus CBS 707.79]